MSKNFIIAPYQKYEFCESINCEYLAALKDGEKLICVNCMAYKFHSFLQVKQEKFQKNLARVGLMVKDINEK